MVPYLQCRAYDWATFRFNWCCNVILPSLSARHAEQDQEKLWLTGQQELLCWLVCQQVFYAFYTDYSGFIPAWRVWDTQMTALALQCMSAGVISSLRCLHQASMRSKILKHRRFNVSCRKCHFKRYIYWKLINWHAEHMALALASSGW